MIKQIKGKMYKININGENRIFEATEDLDNEEQLIINNFKLENCSYYELGLYMYLAKMALLGYSIISVTELKTDGSKPKVAYASNKNYKQVYKYLKSKKNESKEKLKKIQEIIKNESENLIKNKISLYFPISNKYKLIKTFDTYIKNIKEKCEEVDIENIGFNDFNTKKQVLMFYKNISEEKLYKIYNEYYGILEENKDDNE